MTLLRNDGLPIYKPKGGFKYPQAIEFWRTHDKMVWHVDEVQLAQDIKDYAGASEDEKRFLTEIMRLFTQNDVQATTGYTTLLRVFRPFEVLAMLSSFNDREITHVRAYAEFTDTVGMPESVYTDFLNIPVMETKITYLEKAKIKKYEEYKAMGLSDAALDKEFRRDLARQLAVYAGGLEGIQLMAQFAMLLTYQHQGRYPGLSNIVEWSIKDEYVHVQGNSWLFRAYIEENLDIWDDELKYDIYQAIREIVAYEHSLLDYLNPKHLDKNIFKKYVEYCADNALKELGMKANYGISENPCPYMDEITAPIYADFFNTMPTEYSKGIDGSWDDLR